MRERGRREGERKKGGRERRREAKKEGRREGEKERGRGDVLPTHSIAHAHTFKAFETTLEKDRGRKRCEEASRRERRQIQKVEDLRNKMLKEKLHRRDVEGLASTQAEHVASLALAHC